MRWRSTKTPSYQENSVRKFISAAKILFFLHWAHCPKDTACTLRGRVNANCIDSADLSWPYLERHPYDTMEWLTQRNYARCRLMMSYVNCSPCVHRGFWLFFSGWPSYSQHRLWGNAWPEQRPWLEASGHCGTLSRHAQVYKGGPQSPRVEHASIACLHEACTEERGTTVPY